MDRSNIFRLQMGRTGGACLALTFLIFTLAAPSFASHFRGAAMIPSVDANGLLTLRSTSFWRPTAPSGIDESGNPLVTGPGISARTSDVGGNNFDTSDSRFTRNTQTHQIQLPGPGTYQISATSCCRVARIRNARQSTWTMNSTIVWDGVSATHPIQFSFSNIQVEVSRFQDYIDRVDAVAAPGLRLTYDQVLNQNISFQPPGFTIDRSTGAMFIPQASAATYQDNSRNAGADYAFSGNIFSSDGSKVEFDWLFDAVSTPVNQAPDADDQVLIVEVGDVVDTTTTGSDPDGDAVFWSFNVADFIGAAPPAIDPTFDPTTQNFVWDTTGSVPGTYRAPVRASDGSLTDVATITIFVMSDITVNIDIDTNDPRGRSPRIRRPGPEFAGVTCVEPQDPNSPDFTGADIVSFDQLTDEADLTSFEFSPGTGNKTLCCQFIDDNGNLTNALCATVNVPPEPGAVCDTNLDGAVDMADIMNIFARRGTTVASPGTDGDSTNDGLISINDARQCVLEM